MVLRIGRKGTKTVIHPYNLTAAEALGLPDFYTTAWSFQHGAPTREKVPVAVTLREDQLVHLSPASSLTATQKGKLLSMVCVRSAKHLGMTATMQADTSKFALTQVQQTKARLARLRLRRILKIPTRISINSLLTTTISYGSLQANYSPKMLQDLYKLVIRIVKRGMGLSENDAPYMIVIPEKEFGMGITLFHKSHTAALGRELEVTLNSSGLDGKAARARLASLTKRAAQAKPATRNQIENAVRYLARYGWQLRDAHHPMANCVLAL